MALDPVKNFAISRVATAPSPATSGTTLVVEAGDGALFPDPATSGAYNVVIYPNGEQPTSTNAEIVRVTARTSDTMTITREQESTSARTIVEGDIVMLGITAKVVSDLSTAVTGVVTETGTQTLTNKTLTSPTITTPLIDGARGLSSICHLYKSATQSIGNSSAVAITFGNSDYELYDPLGYHSVSTNTERITIGVAGLYLVYGFVQMADNTTNTARFAALNKNGTDFCMSRMATDDGGRWGATLMSPVVCAENDYITLTMFQITGGDLNLTKASLGVLRI